MSKQRVTERPGDGRCPCFLSVPRLSGGLTFRQAQTAKRSSQFQRRPAGIFCFHDFVSQLSKLLRKHQDSAPPRR